MTKKRARVRAARRVRAALRVSLPTAMAVVRFVERMTYASDFGWQHPEANATRLADDFCIVELPGLGVWGTQDSSRRCAQWVGFHHWDRFVSIQEVRL